MRLYTAPAIGTGTSPEDAIRPAVPSDTPCVCYLHDGQFLVATDADLTAIPGVTELTGDAIDAACATFGVTRADLSLDPVTP